MRRKNLPSATITSLAILAAIWIFAAPAYAQDFDAITTPKPGPGEYKVWRIDRPEVRKALTEYPTIRFDPGDVLTFVAGGCVQTGGSGNTWKRYVNPLDSNAGALYSGTVYIPGVVPQGSRIGGLVGNNGQPLKQVPVPANLPASVVAGLYLRLGYEDDKFSDNGYYSHDDGTSNQCKNVGNAYVEVHIRKPPAPPVAIGPTWSPHSKPFDLVWDERDGIDANGLPLNPIWASQITQPTVKPSFTSVCGSALSGGDSINYTTLAANCTSQSPSLDLSTTIIPLLCPGDPLRGHVNWSVATFIGTIAWSEWSGNFLIEDDDFNMALSTTNSAALTNNSDGLGLEFNASESIDSFTNPWWAAIRSNAEGGDDAGVHTRMDGKLAVVTGLFGLDCVHDCYSESHPVYALAIRSSQATAANTADETWNFFVRNSGNEGNCSELWHDWASVDGSYYIQLPWPAGAASVNLAAADANASPFGSGHTSSVKLEQENGWTYLVFQLPPSSEQAGLDGQVTLHYTLAPGGTSTRSLILPGRTITRAHPEDNVGPDALRAHITDAAAQKRFDDANHGGASAWRANFPTHTTKLTVSAAIASHKHVAGPADRGQLTKDVTRPDAARKTAVANAGQKLISTTPLDVNALRKLEPQLGTR